MNTENTQEHAEKEEVTYAQIDEALDNLTLLAHGYSKRIMVIAFVEDEDGDVSSCRIRNTISITCDGKDSSQIRWVAASGHMLRAEEALGGNVDAICEGVRRSFKQN